MNNDMSPATASGAGREAHSVRLAVSDLHVLNLKPVSLGLGAGECVVLEGPSGSGKSLLLRAIADLDLALGRVRLDGEDRGEMSAPEWRRRVRYFAAEPGWWRERVGDHFTLTKDVESLLEAFGLPIDAMDWTVERASTGEKQRLALVRGLADRPRVLLLDEPTSALDDKTAQAVEQQLLARVREDGAAAIIVTHDEAQARRLARRRLEIRDGAVTEVAP